MPEPVTCPLCGSAQTRHFHSDSKRHYHRCAVCDLVFVPERFFLPMADEKALYDMHENNPQDAAYRGFLSRLFEPMLERIPENGCGLDFGCGPEPALAHMLEQAGCRVALYDSFYRTDKDVLHQEYDFICATELVEHLHWPGEVLTQLWSLLRPGGWLGVMTKLVLDAEAFSRWHYKNDPTHVCFFSEATWRWWADEHGAVLERRGADVILLQKT